VGAKSQVWNKFFNYVCYDKMARKKDYNTVDMDLSDAQLRKLTKGGAIIVKPGMFKKGNSVRVSMAQHRKMMTACKKGKGFKLSMSPDELDANEVDMEGGKINWKAIGRTLRKGAQAAGKFYREEIRPEIGPGLKKSVKNIIEKGIPALARAGLTAIGQPELAAAAGPAAKRLADEIAGPATEKLGKLTGAYGMKKKKSKAKPKKAKAMATMIEDMEYPEELPYRAEVQDNYSLFLSPNSPAMNPTLPMPDNSLPVMAMTRRMYTKGRGLSLMGAGLRLKSAAGLTMMGTGAGGQFQLGLPMDPTLPMHDNSLMY
jgi:hypothetical protein